jgi:hypothetical protein
MEYLIENDQGELWNGAKWVLPTSTKDVLALVWKPQDHTWCPPAMFITLLEKINAKVGGTLLTLEQYMQEDAWFDLSYPERKAEELWWERQYAKE